MVKILVINYTSTTPISLITIQDTLIFQYKKENPLDNFNNMIENILWDKLNINDDEINWISLPEDWNKNNIETIIL